MLLAKRPPAGLDSIEYQSSSSHPHSGETVTRKVTISGAGKYGLPTAQDEDVLIALLYLTLEENRDEGNKDNKNRDDDDDRTVYFTRSQLLQILGWPDTGDYYERLKKSLRRWKGVMIVYEKWWDPTLGKGGDFAADEIGFSLLDNYGISDGRRTPPKKQLLLPFFDAEPQRARCFIIWNKTPFSSFKNGHIKKLNLDKFFKLPTPAAKRAYRYLDATLPPADVQEHDLECFACQHVGISTNYKPSRLRSEVQATVINPLEQADFIEPMPLKRRFFKRDGRHYVLFARKASIANLPAEAPTAAPTADQAVLPAASHLLPELRRHHIGGKVARNLIASHPAAYIEQKINFLDFLIDTGKSPKNPAGWLRRALEEDYGPPPGYLPKAEREQKQQAADESKRREQEQREAQRRQEQQEMAARKAEREHIDRYLKDLTPPQREALEKKAIANANEKMREATRNGSTGEIALRLLVDREVLRVCPLPQTAPAT